MTDSSRVEIELLLCCARPETSPPGASSVGELLRQGVDWELLLALSLKHGVMPLVYRKLSKGYAGEVPAPHLAKFREHYQANAARNVYLTGELCRILSDFERQGVDSVPYKGPALAALVYGDIALQQFADLDVLVRKRDFRRASELLVAQGYEPHFKLRERDEAAFLRLSYVQLFKRDGGKCLVELHWQIAPRFYLTPLVTDGFWDGLRKITLAGRHVLAPAPEDLLLMLCVHGTKDAWERLKWVSGLAEFVVANPSIDFARVLDRAGALGLKRTVLLALRLTHELMGTRLPEEVSREIERDASVRKLAAEARGWLFGAPPDLARRTRFHLRARERVRDRARYCALFALTTTPVDWAVMPLPRSLSFVYYLLRPVRLFKKYVLGSAHRAS